MTVTSACITKWERDTSNSFIRLRVCSCHLRRRHSRLVHMSLIFVPHFRLPSFLNLIQLLLRTLLLPGRCLCIISVAFPLLIMLVVVPRGDTRHAYPKFFVQFPVIPFVAKRIYTHGKVSSRPTANRTTEVRSFWKKNIHNQPVQLLRLVVAKFMVAPSKSWCRCHVPIRTILPDC
jgi:hypothetical protein